MSSIDASVPPAWTALTGGQRRALRAILSDLYGTPFKLVSEATLRQVAHSTARLFGRRADDPAVFAAVVGEGATLACRRLDRLMADSKGPTPLGLHFDAGAVAAAVGDADADVEQEFDFGLEPSTLCLSQETLALTPPQSQEIAATVQKPKPRPRRRKQHRSG